MAETAAVGNLLGFETSPYLLQHQDNPVHWVPWSAAAFDRARQENKPILLSVGYAACHWCHVMAHECFEDEAIAALMNALFVNVKVDREERPDLDQIYQAALAMLGQQGGWPLTMFLTPDGEPFWGGTYFPPRPRYGRPGFPEILRGIADTYRTDADKIGRNVTALRDALRATGQSKSGGQITPEAVFQLTERLIREVDPFSGGIGDAPKFPQTSLFHLFWRAWLATGKTPYHTAVTNTLTQMCQGGIYDHLGGGFARYATDAAWLVPHFEKMLYDNAQLIELLALVWQETRNPLYAQRVEEAIAWVMREMLSTETGGFASTLDADSEGEEGRFYVWTETEIDAVLGDDAPLFKTAYDVTPHGNWEGKTILNRSHDLALRDDATERALAQARGRLLEARARRVRPGWDDKVLADWNGLMIRALCFAARVFERPNWLATARRAFDAVCRTHGDADRLVHSWRRGQTRHAGMLDDYANMAAAALALFEATAEMTYLERAIGWTNSLDAQFWDAAAGGYFYTDADAEDLIVRTKTAYDNAVPSGNGIMLGVLGRLFLFTGRTVYADRADALRHAFAGEVERNFFPLATYLKECLFLDQALQVTVVGAPEADNTKALVRAVLDRSLPDCLLIAVAPNQSLPPGHPAAGKPQVDGVPTAYVCRGMICDAPITTPTALHDALVETLPAHVTP